MKRCSIGWPAAVLLSWSLLTGCGTGGEPHAPAPTIVDEAVVAIPADRLWGGELRCRADGCWLFAIEHEKGATILHRIARRTIEARATAPTAYHPDGARWIDDRYAVAAVEESQSLDIFDTAQQQLTRVAQARVPFAPRNVAVWPAAGGRYWLLALPYAGRQVAWWEWDPAQGLVNEPLVQTWCDEPWYVDAWKASSAALPLPGVLVACNAAQVVGYVPLKNVAPSRADVAQATWQLLRTFPYRSRQLRLTPSQRYLYVTQDLGAQVARMDTKTGVWSSLAHPSERASSVAPLDDRRVAWGGDRAIHLVEYDDRGHVRAHRAIPFEGYVEQLQWYDIEGMGSPALLALDLSATASRVLFDVRWPKP